MISSWTDDRITIITILQNAVIINKPSNAVFSQKWFGNSLLEKSTKN